MTQLRQDLDLRHLRYFVAVVESVTYARAAERLGITQSALTQSIVRLECILGVRLFDRGRNGSSLTADGRLLFPRAQSIIAETQLAAAEMSHSARTGRARVAVGLGKSIVGSVVPDAICKLYVSRPEVSVSIVEGWSPELFYKLMHGELDFVISAPLPHYVVDLELRQEQLYTQTEAVIVGRRHPLAAMERISLGDLSNALWVLPPQGSGRNKFLRCVFQDAGVEPPVNCVRSESIDVGIGLLRTGVAVAHGILEVVRQYMRDDEFRVLPIASLTFKRAIYATVRRRYRLQPTASLFLSIIRACSAETIKGSTQFEQSMATNARNT